jgi:hypothetical protein
LTASSSTTKTFPGIVPVIVLDNRCELNLLQTGNEYESSDREDRVRE